MKRLYFFCMILTLLSAVADLIFSLLELYSLVLVSSIVMLVFLTMAIIVYFGFVKFKCPKCKTIFRGGRLEMFFAPHTPSKRRMFCPMCQQKIWCDDVFCDNKNSVNK